MSVATSSSYKDKTSGEWQETTEWHNVVLWQRLAEVAGEFCRKGDKVYVEGRLQTRSWDDKQTGEKKYMTEIVANELVFMGNKGGGGGQQSNTKRGGIPDEFNQENKGDEFSDAPF
jgi:single-strand DNA-binding protein